MAKTLQEAYEHIRKNLVVQKFPSRHDALCLYRGPEGRKCAIGWLIEDASYDPILERHLINTPVIKRALDDSGWPITGAALRFYGQTQHWHDCHLPNQALDIERLDALAHSFGLKVV